MRPATLSLPRRNAATAVAAACCLWLASCGDKTAAEGTRPATAPVSQGPLRITVTEGGALASAKPVTIYSEMEGRSTIIYLIPEGTAVKQGDVLVRLDAADLKDKLNKQEIDVEQSLATADAAAKAHVIQVSENESEIRAADLKGTLAEVDYNKYIHGDYPQQKLEFESDKKIAEEELKRAEDRVEWSRKLFEKNFITKTELEADELASTKAKLKIDLAEKALEVLNKYERDKQEKKLKAEFEEAVAELVRVKARAEANARKTETDAKTRARTAELAKSRFEEMKQQLERSVIVSPAAGFVVYQRQDRGRMGTEPMAEGKQVNEREPILQIPDTRFMLVDVDVHESLVKKVKPGQRATVRIDAIPGKIFEGAVARVSQVPSTANSWMNPDLKTYPTQVEISGAIDEMKPGMNARVDIQVADLADAVQIPIQAVHETGGKAFAYVDAAGKAELRSVEIGLDNGRNVHVRSGLAVGERVFLSTPSGAPPLPDLDADGPPMPSAVAESAAPKEGTAVDPANGGGGEASPSGPPRRRGEGGAWPAGSEGRPPGGRRDGAGRTRGEGRGDGDPTKAKDPNTPPSQAKEDARKPDGSSEDRGGKRP
jgi:HlyD family secretion protein